MLLLEPHVPPKLLYWHGRGTSRLPDTKAGLRTISLSSEAARVLAAIPRVDDNPIVIPGWIKGKAMRNLNDPWEIVCELQWNRSAARGELDASNAHYMVARLATVAFERHGFELATIAPGGERVFKHYSTVGTVREGIRIVAGIPGREEEENLRRQWIELSSQARVEVSNTATRALKTQGLPLESEDGTDSPDEQ